MFNRIRLETFETVPILAKKNEIVDEWRSYEVKLGGIYLPASLFWIFFATEGALRYRGKEVAQRKNEVLAHRGVECLRCIYYLSLFVMNFYLVRALL